MMVRWSKRALSEFSATVSYVTREFGKMAAIKMIEGVENAVSCIEQFPNVGVASFIDEETGIEFREFHCRLNSVVYAVHCDEVYIVSIWNNRQDRSKLYTSLRNDTRTQE